jgi:hypothetical protein
MIFRLWRSGCFGYSTGRAYYLRPQMSSTTIETLLKTLDQDYSSLNVLETPKSAEILTDIAQKWAKNGPTNEDITILVLKIFCTILVYILVYFGVSISNIPRGDGTFSNRFYFAPKSEFS